MHSSIEEQFVSFFDFLFQNIEFQAPALNNQSMNSLVQFLLSESVMLNSDLGDNVKFAALDLNKIICENYKFLFDPKDENSSF